MQNAEHFKPGGPIFIVIGGEWKISPGHIQSGQHIYDIAKEFNGLLIYTEHRFYGKTVPTKYSLGAIGILYEKNLNLFYYFQNCFDRELEIFVR